MHASLLRDRKPTLIDKLSKTFAASRGYQVTKIVQEIGSSVNDTKHDLVDDFIAVMTQEAP